MSTTDLKPLNEPAGEPGRDRCREVAGRVVDHDVEPAEPFDDAVDDSLHRVRVTNVGRVDVDVHPLGRELSSRRLDHLRLPAGDGDARPVLAQQAGDLLADPGASAGDEGDLAGQDVGAKWTRWRRSWVGHQPSRSRRLRTSFGQTIQMVLVVRWWMTQPSPDRFTWSTYRIPKVMLAPPVSDPTW